MSYYDKDGGRKEPYKEDETRGSSIVKPLNYKCDTLTQAWVDSRVLVTLDNWLRKKGFIPKSMSEVVRKPLEILVEHLVEIKDIEILEDTTEARNTLQYRYRVKLNRGERSGKNILHNQILSSQRNELGEKVMEGSRFNDTQRPAMRAGRVDKETLAKAVEIFNTIGEKSIEEVRAEAIEAARNSTLMVKKGENNPPESWNRSWNRKTDVPRQLNKAEMDEKEREIARREKERIALENAPIEEQIEYMKKHGIDLRDPILVKKE